MEGGLANNAVVTGGEGGEAVCGEKTLPCLRSKAEASDLELVTEKDKCTSTCNAALGAARLREKYELVKGMRSNEAQEALARECELSSIILEYKKRVDNMDLSRKFEREVHERESFYLIKENECLKEQIRCLEKMLVDTGSNYDAELSQLRAELSTVKDLLLAERERFKAREAEQERSIQRLCGCLYALTDEREKCSELSNELSCVKQSLQQAVDKYNKTWGECALWQDILQLREVFLLLERESLLELHSSQMNEMSRPSRCNEKQHHTTDLCNAEHLMSCVEFQVELYHEMKGLIFENAAISVEMDMWIARHCLKMKELSVLTEKYEALSLQITENMREFEKKQRDSAEHVAWLTTLNDAFPSYVLYQRDIEVSDKLRDWKNGLLEAHMFLRELLKRYEPFQRGDEVFVARVMDCLASAPHVKEPVNVWLP